MHVVLLAQFPASGRSVPATFVDDRAHAGRLDRGPIAGQDSDPRIQACETLELRRCGGAIRQTKFATTLAPNGAPTSGSRRWTAIRLRRRVARVLVTVAGRCRRTREAAQEEITILRHLILGLAAATLVITTLIPDDALAHHGGYRHRAAWRGFAWGPDPRAGRAGYYGGHYGSDCYRAANGRLICPDRY